MRLQLDLTRHAGGGWVTNPATGETYPCTFTLEYVRSAPRLDPRTLVPFVDPTTETVKVQIEIPDEAFRTFGGGPPRSLPEGGKDP